MILAQTTAPETLLDWVQFGVLGLVVIALIMGWLWAKPSVDQLLASISRLSNENAVLREEIAKLRNDHSNCETQIIQLRRDLDRAKRR